MRRRRASGAALAGAAALVAALAGCGNLGAGPPVGQPTVALGLGQEVVSVDQRLIGTVRAPQDPTTQKARRDLWSEAYRLEGDIPERLGWASPGGRELRVAAHAARSAAVALREPHPDAVAAVNLLSTSATALRHAADALAPHLPASAAGRLDAMRNPLPPGSEQA